MIKKFQAFTESLNQKSYQLTYEVPTKWFNNPASMLENNLLCWKIAGIITDYHIIKREEFFQEENITRFLVEINTNRPLNEVQAYIEGHTTRIEKVTLN